MAGQPLWKLADFSGPFSFDMFYESLVKDAFCTPAQDAASHDRHFDDAHPVDGIRDGSINMEPMLPFPEAPKLLPLFRYTRKALAGLDLKVNEHLNKQREDIGVYEKEHKHNFEELQEGVEELAESFDRLDSRVASVEQIAAKIGDHLESSDSQKNIAKETIDLVRYMMYFNESLGYKEEEPPLFSDDDHVAEATIVAQKLRAIAEDNMVNGGMGVLQGKPIGNANGHLEVAARNLQAYCNELENCLLGQFDAAAQKGDLCTMGDRAKILTQFNKGSSMMQRYVASRPMFMDVEVMNKDVRMVRGTDPGRTLNVDDILSGLTSVYKEISESVQLEAKTVATIFPCPTLVMSILLQRVMEQRVNLLIEKTLSKPSLSNPPPMEVGGIQHYLRILAGAYAKTKELASEFQAFGCGDLKVEAFAESLFKSYREDYAEFELTSLHQLHTTKVHSLVAFWKLSPSKIMELKTFPFASLKRTSLRHPLPQQPQRTNSAMHAHAPISVFVVEDFVEWNEEAIARCKLLTLEDQQTGILATNVKAIFTCLLDQVSQYVTEGLERAIEALREAAALRERFGYNASSSRKVAQAMAASAEAASSAGESSYRAFMAAIKSATTNMALLQRFFTRSVSRVLLAQGVHAACCDAIASAMAVAEKAASTGLRGSLEAILAEVERLLVAEQKATDYKQLDESVSPELTTACSRVVTFVARMVDVANGALDGLNKEAFMTQLGYGLYNCLMRHWKRFTFDPSGGLRLKRDVAEYADCVRSFITPTIDEKFALLGTMVNVFIVAPESLPPLVDGTLRDVRDEVLRLIELREDYKKANVANIVINMRG